MDKFCLTFIALTIAIHAFACQGLDESSVTVEKLTAVETNYELPQPDIVLATASHDSASSHPEPPLRIQTQPFSEEDKKWIEHTEKNI